MILLEPMLVAAIPLLLGFRLVTDATFNVYYFLVPTVGILIGGVAGMVSSAIAADLGKRDDVGQENLSTIAGIIDGTGAFGAAIGQLIIGVLEQNFDWDAVFYFLISVCIVPSLMYIPTFLREIQEFRNRGSGPTDYAEERHGIN
jgi:sugar phosphate permease